MRTLALFALVSGGLSCAESDPAVGPVAFWCADRDGGWIHGVDDRLYIARSIAVERPVSVEPGPLDSLWIVSAPRGRASPHRIVRVDPEAGELEGHDVGVVLEAAAERGRLWFLERRLRDVTLASVSSEGRLERRVSLPSAVCLSATSGRVAVGTRDERLLIFATGATANSPAPTAVHRLPGEPGDLCPGPPGLWWVALEDPARLLLIDERRGVHWSRPATLRDVLLSGGGGEVEVLDALRGHRVVFDLAGVRTQRERLPLRGLAAGVRSGRRRRVFCSPGALCSIDDASGRESTQGGFESLVDVIAVP